jgi:hypothetical protein
MATGTSPSPLGGKTDPWPGFFQQLADQDICLPSRQAVEDYLVEHQDLSLAVHEACKTARKEFAGVAELSLEVYHDPETRDRYLVLYVRQDPYDAQIIARIERLSEPLADDLSQKSAFFLITTDFALPGCKRGV